MTWRGAFAYANCYDVLKGRFSARLEPCSLGTTVAGVERGGHRGQIEFDVQANAGEGSGSEIAADGAGTADRETPCFLTCSGPAGAPKSRPQGSKAVKRSRRSLHGMDAINEDIASVSVAFSSYTAAFKSASDRSLNQSEENSQARRLRAEAASLRAGLDAYKVLVSEGAGASAADRDIHCDLLRQQAMKQVQSAIQVPGAVPLTGSSPIFLGREMSGNTSSSSSIRRPSEPHAHQSQLVAPPVSYPEGFRCAASCRHSDLPKPPSLCPSPCCKGDESGGRNVHKICVVEIWDQCGRQWPEPTAGETKFCSEDCFLTMK
jgi:hypothetical protein